ncbi:MAG: hypothetical protein M0P69_18700 [Bacteroidales bacterium]|nr:hypothetical protein [Bacteroidales bacterium]
MANKPTKKVLEERLTLAREVKAAKALLTAQGYVVAKVDTSARPTKAEVEATRTPVKANPNHSPAPARKASKSANPVLYKSITRSLKVKNLRETNLDNQLNSYVEAHPQYNVDEMKAVLKKHGVLITAYKRYEVIDFEGKQPLDLTPVTFA